MAEKFLKNDPNLITEEIINEFKSWHTNVKIVLLNYLEKNLKRINNEIYNCLREKLNLHFGYNVEISYQWYQICLDLKKEDSIEYIKKFLLCNGRMKYIKPLYFKLYAYDKEDAKNFFKENKYMVKFILLNFFSLLNFYFIKFFFIKFFLLNFFFLFFCFTFFS
jgi:hypothetical protein